MLSYPILGARVPPVLLLGHWGNTSFWALRGRGPMDIFPQTFDVLQGGPAYNG